MAEQRLAIVVTGSRNLGDGSLVMEALVDLAARTVHDDTPLVIHGAARGADTLAGVVANRLGWNVLPMPAQWGKHGRQAGPVRNAHMADVAAALRECGYTVRGLAFPAPDSKGTRDMMSRLDVVQVPYEVREVLDG